jgi:hypothetical protein
MEVYEFDGKIGDMLAFDELVLLLCRLLLLLGCLDQIPDFIQKIVLVQEKNFLFVKIVLSKC